MNIQFGINTGFAVNRFPLHQDWISLISDTFGLEFAQLTADIINPSLPDKIYYENAKLISIYTKKNNLVINSLFTGAFTRVNHFSHPDKNIRNYWQQWFQKFVNLAEILEVESIGSHLGILTFYDEKNIKLRKLRTEQCINEWHKLAYYASSRGLKFITWEPMSIAREFGETINKCKKIHKKLNQNSPLPFKLCLDVDHGDVQSKNPKDTNPYIWLEELVNDSSELHLKQSNKNKMGHWPFTNEYNRTGKIVPNKILNIIKSSKHSSYKLFLELSFKERQPFDKNIIKTIKESVKYWQSFLKD